MSENIKVWNHVDGFEPNDCLICYRSDKGDTLYMPLKAQHEWFLRAHPDGSVLTQVEDNGIHASVRAIVSYDGREVTDAYADGWKERDLDYVSKAARLAKRYALSVAGFGMPANAHLTEKTPIILVQNDAQVPDDSMGISMPVPIPPMPAAPAAETSAAQSAEKVEKASNTATAPVPPIPADSAANNEPKPARAKKKQGQVKSNDAIMVEDDTPASPTPKNDENAKAEPNHDGQPLSGEQQSELLATAQPKPAMTYEEALEYIIESGKYKGMSLKMARKLDGNKVILAYLKGWYDGRPVQEAAKIIAEKEGIK